jgi:CRISPR-associated protein Cmr6
MYSQELAGEARASELKKIADSTIHETYKAAFEARCVAIRSLNHSTIVCAKTVAPLVVGFGSQTAYEVGFEFSRPYGIPRIPGSALKGVMRRVAAEKLGIFETRDLDGSNQSLNRMDFQPSMTIEEVLELVNEDKESATQDWMEVFGHRDAAGAFVVYDAWLEPTENFLMADVMSVHHAQYYSGKQVVPSETDEPVPVSYISVMPGVSFSFAIRAGSTAMLVPLIELLGEALVVKGIGAKTNMGYGRFALVDNSNQHS